MDFMTTFYNFDMANEMNKNSPGKTFNVYRNGNPKALLRMKFQESRGLEESVTYIKQKFKFTNENRLRMFSSEGVEIYPEDFKYMKDDSSIFISKGEVFDPSSALCDYVIMRKLGEGSFGEVNLAAHKTTKQLFAIKFLKKPKQIDAAGLDRFFVEAETLKNLSHKNIIKIHNCFTLKDMQIAIVMEYLEGGTLLNYVKKRKTLPEDEARNFFKQMVEGVSHCHYNKVIHCDLKLENILLESEASKNIKIIDFGISGLKTHFKAKVGGGSLHHMSPEVLTGKRKDVHSGIDIWALGCMLYEMLCGKWVFYGEDAKQITSAICKGKFSFGSMKTILSEDVKNLITQMLEMDPLKRIGIAQIQNHPWMNPVQAPKEVPRSVVRLDSNLVSQIEKIASQDSKGNVKKKAFVKNKYAFDDYDTQKLNSMFKHK